MGTYVAASCNRTYSLSQRLVITFYCSAIYRIQQDVYRSEGLQTHQWSAFKQQVTPAFWFWSVYTLNRKFSIVIDPPACPCYVRIFSDKNGILTLIGSRVVQSNTVGRPWKNWIDGIRQDWKVDISWEETYECCVDREDWHLSAQRVNAMNY